MSYIDTEVYETLVIDSSKETLLENLLAYSYYQEEKIRIVTRYYNRYHTIPSDDFIRDVLATDEAIKQYRAKAKADLPEQILAEVKESSKRDTATGRFIQRTLSSLLARIIFEGLSIGALYLIWHFGFSEHWIKIKSKLGL